MGNVAGQPGAGCSRPSENTAAEEVDVFGEHPVAGSQDISVTEHLVAEGEASCACCGPAAAEEALVVDRVMTEDEAARILCPPRLALEGHENWVVAAAAFPDGRRVATASADRTAALWDAGTGHRLLELRGHGYTVFAVAVFPDGSRVVTASRDRTAAVWSAASGERLLELKGHTDWVLAVAVFPDGLRVVTGSYDKTAVIWDTADGQRLLTLTGHTSSVLAVAVFPDGLKVAVGSADKTAAVWDTTSGERLLTLAGHTNNVRAVAAFPDGLRLATASQDGTAAVWNSASGQRLLTLAGHTDAVLAVAVFPEGSRVATASADKTAAVWDATSGLRLLELKGHTREVNAVAVFPDGSRVATAADDGTAIVFGSSEAPSDATREQYICAAAWHQASSHAHSSPSLGEVIACRVSFKPALGRCLTLVREPKDIDALLDEFRAFKITSCEFYRHWFPGMRGRGIYLNERGLELFHAFVFLKAEGHMEGEETVVPIFIEKFADNLEIMCSDHDDVLRSYGCRWRATGEARHISDGRPVTKDAPMKIQTDITVADLQEWLAGPLAMMCQGYSLSTQNCQHFVLNLQEFLQGRSKLEDLRTTI